LNVIFGVYLSGSSFTALCGGSSTPLGSLPAARGVELRLLNGLGDVIIRDQYDAILARHSYRYTAAPQYVGFRGGLLRVYSVEAWGKQFFVAGLRKGISVFAGVSRVWRKKTRGGEVFTLCRGV
jgi:hypothetical protein